MKFRLAANVIKDVYLMKLKVSNMKTSLNYIIGSGKVSTKSLFNG